MIAVIVGALQSIGWRALAVIGVIVTVVLVLARAKQAGRVAERIEQERKIRDAVREKAKTDTGWAGLPDGELRRRMREQRDKLRQLLRPE